MHGTKILDTALHLDKNNHKRIIGTPGYGILIANSLDELSNNQQLYLDGITVNDIEPYKDDILLISTDGNGVYKLYLNTNQIEHFITADYETENGMNGNSIKDILIDEEDRIWMANFPIGVTIRELGY